MNLAAQSAAECEKLITDFKLARHEEGGCFAEVYTSEALLGNEQESRPAGGSIYFLLPPGAISHYHEIDCEELWYYHQGCGLKLYIISADGRLSVQKLGMKVDEGERPMLVIPRGAIFAAENLQADGYTFVSCATVPKFRYSGFRLVGYEELQKFGVEERLCDHS